MLSYSRPDKYLCGHLMSDMGRVEDPLDRPIYPREVENVCECNWDEERVCRHRMRRGVKSTASKYNKDFKTMPNGF